MDERRIGVGPFFAAHVRRLEATGLPQDRFVARSIRELFSGRYASLQSEDAVGLSQSTDPLALYFVGIDGTKFPKACLAIRDKHEMEQHAVEKFRAKIDSLPDANLTEFLDVYAELLKRQGLQTLVGIILTRVAEDANDDISILYPKFVFTPDNISGLLRIPQDDPRLGGLLSIMASRGKELAAAPAIKLLKRYPPGHGEAFYFAKT